MATEKQMQVTDEDLPSLFREADQASVKAQRLYIWLVKFDLSFIVIGALLASIGMSNDTAKAILITLGTVILFISTILTIVIRLKPIRFS